MPPKRTGKAAPKASAACGDSGAAACGKATGKSVNGDSGLTPLLHSDHLQAITVHTPGVGQSSTVETDPSKTSSSNGQSKQPKSLEEQKASKRALWMSMLTLVISIPALVGA